MKKILRTVCMLALILSLLMVSAPTAMAADFLEDPVIYGLGYYTGTLNADGFDDYKLVVPATGTVVFSVYSPEAGDGAMSGVWVKVLDPNKGLAQIKQISTYSYHTSEEKVNKVPVSLDAGEYIVRVDNVSWNDSCTYGVKFDYVFDSSTRAKVTSPGKGKIKITAPRGSNVDGFEVRYKKEGDSSWTSKTIEGNKALKTYLGNLKSGKKYYVQTRKYVTDDYDYKYYSNWTKKQSVTVK